MTRVAESQSSSNKATAIILIAAALLVGVGLVFMLEDTEAPPAEPVTESAQPAAQPGEPKPNEPKPSEPARADPAPPPAAAAKAGGVPQQPNADAIDLFAGEMPDFMAEAHMRVLDNQRLHPSKAKELYDYGMENKQDARPQMLLSMDALNREWYGFLSRHYRMAYRADPRVKDIPEVLSNLVWVAGNYDRVEYREATEVLHMMYGAKALPEVEARLEEAVAANQDKRIERLSKLRDALTE